MRRLIEAAMDLVQCFGWTKKEVATQIESGLTAIDELESEQGS